MVKKQSKRAVRAVKRFPKLYRALNDQNVEQVKALLQEHPDLANWELVDERNPRSSLTTPLLIICQKEGIVKNLKKYISIQIDHY